MTGFKTDIKTGFKTDIETGFKTDIKTDLLTGHLTAFQAVCVIDGGERVAYLKHDM